MTRLISSASAAGTVENAAVRSTSAMPLPSLMPAAALVACGGRGAERVETRLEPAPPDAHADRLGEVQGRVRLFPGDDLLAESAQRRERLVTHSPVDEGLGALGVQARGLDRLL